MNNEIKNLIENIVRDYLDDHSDLRKLFNEESSNKDVLSFFKDNFDDIYAIMGRLFHEHEQTKKRLNDLYDDYLSYIESDWFDSINSKNLKTYQKRMIVATMIYLILEKDLTIDDLPIDYYYLEKNNGKYWYRGQSDYQWHLMPSMFRNLGNVFTNETRINTKTIEQIYFDNGIIDKWNRIFSTSKIDYRFLSYMQHAISYSPLLDFTSDFPVALSFSLSNRGSINDFAYKDASIYQIEVRNNQTSDVNTQIMPNDFYIDFVPNKYVIGTPILGRSMKTYSDIIKALTPEFVMIDSETNDRMRYQKGRFLFFYNYLSFQGTIFTWLNKDLHVTKYRIKKDEKNSWCDELRKNCPYLMVDKMMNPYNYFSDQ